ncbi:MAG: hypothetical protein ACRDOL_27110 [Streptosporangiaceae bacterium]
MRGDKLDDQLFTLPDRRTALAIDAAGPPADLAAHAASWFSSVLARPIVLHEWLQFRPRSMRRGICSRTPMRAS